MIGSENRRMLGEGADESEGGGGDEEDSRFRPSRPS